MIRLLLKILIFLSSFRLFKKLTKKIERPHAIENQEDQEIQTATDVPAENIEFIEEEVQEEKEADQTELTETEDKEEEIEKEFEKSSDKSERDMLEKESKEIEAEIPEDKQRTSEQFISPSKRGGRPRKTHADSQRKKITKAKTRHPKIDLVCWNEEFAWVIGVEISDSPEIFQVTQNGESLEPESSQESRLQLIDMEGLLKFEWEEDEINIPLLSREKEYFIFKTRKNWKGLGRLVKHSTSGFYLVVVPKDWKRDKDLSGNAPIEPEETHISDYRAHFFHLDHNYNNIGFINSDGVPIRIKSKDCAFELKGEKIEDASENMGPIFVKKPPTLCATANEWNDVNLIVVGEEGSGKRKWRTSFLPKKGEQEQIFPTDFTKRNGGWYFVRIYDADNNLLESMDFRSMKALYRIGVSSYKSLPDEEGHKPCELTFYHEPGCEVKLKNGSRKKMKIYKQSYKTVTEVPVKPSWDVSDWTIRYGKAKIDIEILIERVWWGLIDEKAKSVSILKAPFTDKPINADHSFFLPTSKKAICIWLPTPAWAKELYVSLDDACKKKYPIKTSERDVCIPTKDFFDETKDLSEEAEIKVWITSHDNTQYSTTLCRIKPEAVSIDEPWQDEESEAEEEAGDITIATKNKACCGSCDHARMQYGSCWCRRFRWPRFIRKDFETKYSHYRCAEWRGEYYDIDKDDWIYEVDPWQ